MEVGSTPPTRWAPVEGPPKTLSVMFQMAPPRGVRASQPDLRNPGFVPGFLLS